MPEPVRVFALEVEYLTHSQHSYGWLVVVAHSRDEAKQMVNARKQRSSNPFQQDPKLYSPLERPHVTDEEWAKARELSHGDVIIAPDAGCC